MPIEWDQESDRLVVCRISGLLTLKEWEDLNSGGESPVSEQGKMRALLLLREFQGWDKAEGWGDLGFVDENDERLDRIAAVGEEHWRDEVELFMLKGLRPVEIRYFGPDEESLARAWLEG